MNIASRCQHAPHRPRPWARASSSASNIARACEPFGGIDQQARVPESQQFVVVAHAVDVHIRKQSAVLVPRHGVGFERDRVDPRAVHAYTRSPPARNTAPACADPSSPECPRPRSGSVRRGRSRSARRSCRRRSCARPLRDISPRHARPTTSPTRRSRAGRRRASRTRPGSGPCADGIRQLRRNLPPQSRISLTTASVVHNTRAARVDEGGKR